MAIDLLEKQIKENHKLLQENNLLLQQIIEQNQLIFRITQGTISHYSPWFYSVYPEDENVKKMKKELSDLYKKAMK